MGRPVALIARYTYYRELDRQVFRRRTFYFKENGKWISDGAWYGAIRDPDNVRMRLDMESQTLDLDPSVPADPVH